MKRIRRPSPALIVSCLALLVALSGTGIAAVNALPRNSVGSLQLKANSVSSPKVKNGSLLKADFKEGQIPAGAAGPAGPAGTPGVVGDLTLHMGSVDVPGDTFPGNGTFANRSVTVTCASDERGITGGTNWAGEGDTTALHTVLSTPIYDAATKKITGWRARGGNDTSTTKTFQVVILCTK